MSVDRRSYGNTAQVEYAYLCSEGGDELRSVDEGESFFGLQLQRLEAVRLQHVHGRLVVM